MPRCPNRPRLHFSRLAPWVLSLGFAICGAPAWASTELGLIQACEHALAGNSQLSVQRQQVQVSRGARLVQQGAFDPVWTQSVSNSRKLTPLTDEIQQNTGLSSLQSHTTGIESGLSVLSPSGIRMAPSIQLSRNSDDQNQRQGLNSAQLSLQVVFPLARNRGEHLSSFRERAAALEEQATLSDLQHQSAQVLNGTAAAYWQYAGALLTLRAYQEAEQRAAAMVKSVEAMASVDLIPRIQVQDAVSNLSSRAVARIGQERAVVQARQELMLAMGSAAPTALRHVHPTDPLPLGGDGVISLDNIGRYIDLARTHRADLHAARTRLEQQHLLLTGLREQRRPQIDLVVGMSYAGTRTGSGVNALVSPLWRSPAGPSLSATLQVQLPLGNREAEGAVLQADATREQQSLRASEADRQVEAGVVLGLQNLKSAQQQLEESGRGVLAARTSHEGAQEKLRRGIGSVLDTLQTEDRFITALVNQISARVALANAIAGLRFATGTFFPAHQAQHVLSHDLFYKPLNLDTLP